jgi:hypothetical protein
MNGGGLFLLLCRMMMKLLFDLHHKLVKIANSSSFSLGFRFVYVIDFSVFAEGVYFIG